MSFFMHKLRKLDPTNWSETIEVHSSLLKAVLFGKPGIRREAFTFRDYEVSKETAPARKRRGRSGGMEHAKLSSLSITWALYQS